MKIFIYFLTLSALLGCCDQIPKKSVSTESGSLGPNEEDISIKYINKKKGESKDYDSVDNESIIKLISDLLSQSEPLRIHLDENEMNELFNQNDFLEISFAKAYFTHNGTLAISKFVYFLSGTYKNDYSANISYFFIATEDGQFIQSPFASERNTRNEIEKYLMKKP